jgi:methylglutaconyl-CoA hydratase
VTYRHLTSVADGSIERLTLNRPDVRNTLNDETIAELTHWAARVRTHRDLRAIVVAGAGPVFSAGADVAWMARTVDYSEAENLKDATALSRMFVAIDTLPIPIIGRVHGAAIGGGAGLAAVCDVVVAEEETIFGFTEVKLGIVPAVIAPFVLAKIGRSAARELFLTGARFSAARALEIGLAHRRVPAASLDETVDLCLREILAAGPEAVAAAKTLIREIWDRPLAQASAAAIRTIAERRVSAEGQEGLRAFLEKRRPSWSRPAPRKNPADQP